MRRCRWKIMLCRFRLPASITADPAGIITGVESTTWRKDLTEAWKSSEEKTQDESQCNNREMIVTGRSTKSRGKTSRGNLKADYWRWMPCVMFPLELHPLQKATRQKIKLSLLKYVYEDISK